ncbi:MAG: hypothetical protein HRT88_13845 [Lentisphaeraceae bacterium]|nr:hypothetical protein [Lentisphaeraceae bacterium]
MNKILLILALLLGAVSEHAKQADISFTSEPGFDKIGPDVTVAKLKFTLSLDGQLVDGNVRIQLASPVKNTGFSTDFPIVESTQLFDTTALTQDGVLILDYLFPIRGEYKLTVTVESAVTGAFETSVLQQSFTLNENPDEVNNFTILVTILVAFGLISGFVMGRGAFLKAAVQEELA